MLHGQSRAIATPACVQHALAAAVSARSASELMPLCSNGNFQRRIKFNAHARCARTETCILMTFRSANLCLAHFGCCTAPDGSQKARRAAGSNASHWCTRAGRPRTGTTGCGSRSRDKAASASALRHAPFRVVIPGRRAGGVCAGGVCAGIQWSADVLCCRMVLMASSALLLKSRRITSEETFRIPFGR